MSVYQNSKFPVRNKSSDKLTHSPFGHNNYPMYPPKNYIAPQAKNITPNIAVTHSKNNLKNTRTNQLTKSHQYQIEGDLESDYKKNTNNIISKNNSKKNPFDNTTSSVHLNNHNNYVKHIQNASTHNKKQHLPRKSPVPLPRDYNNINNPYLRNLKYKTPYSFLNYQSKSKNNSHNNLFSNIQNSNLNGQTQHHKSNSKSKSNSNMRSQSPILRIKEHSPRINPNESTKISKSPVPGNYGFLNNFKKFHLQSNYFVNNANRNNRPKSSNNMDKLLKIRREEEEQGDISDRLNRRIEGNINNLNVIKVNNQDDVRNNNNINNVNVYNANSFKNQTNRIYHTTEDTKSQPLNNYNPYNNIEKPSKGSSYIPSKDNSTNNSILNNQLTQKKKNPRSNSTEMPQKLSEIVNNKQIQKQESKKVLPYRKNRPRIHHFTHVGFDGEADKAHNQDIAFIEENFTGNQNYIYMSVCDGHGVEGHNVSGFIKKILPKEMTYNLRGLDLETNSSHLKGKIHKIISETFINANIELVNNPEVNSTFSGSTCVSVIFTPTKLICPNIGDSRAVIGRLSSNGTWTSHDLTRDHKPTEPDEKRRIEMNNGRIQPFIDEDTGEFIGPQRVWIKEDDVPGLAMTRSFGDQVAAMVGVMSEPEIFEYELKEEDKFFLVASDGVWEFITSNECINIIKDFYIKKDMEHCCEYLYKESKKRWMKEEEVVDDITMILVYLD